MNRNHFETGNGNLDLALGGLIENGKPFPLQLVVDKVAEKDGGVASTDRCLQALSVFLSGRTLDLDDGQITGDELNSFIQENPDQVIAKLVELGAKKGAESTPEESIKKFYGEKLESIYQIVKAQKAKSKPGERVRSADIAAYLESIGEKELAQQLRENESVSKPLWEQFSRKKEIEYNLKESSSLEAFVSRSMPVDSPLWHNLDEAIKQFQKLHPEYANPKKVAWYKKYFEGQLKDSGRKAEYFAWENKMIAGFLKDHERDENFWVNPQNALAELIKTRPEYKNKKSADHFTKLFNEAIDAYNKKESADFDRFLQTTMPLTSPLWDDLDKAVAEFQQLDPRYQTNRTREWYKNKLADLKKDREAEYNKLENAKFNQFIDQAIANNPRLIENPNALVAQFQSAHKEYSASSKTSHYLKLVDQWKKENADSFFSRENATITTFLGQISPEELDNPQAALTRYQSQTEFKTEKNGQWFMEKLAAHTSEVRNEQNQQYRQLAAKVGDPVIAGAMVKSFENTQSFALRHRYLTPGDSESIQTKVAEYAPLVAKIGELEKKVKGQAEASKELKAKLELAQQRYQSGKAHYDTTFYSPRAYSEYLGTLLESSDQLIEQEALPEISSKSFKDVPDLPKKELSYEEFRDELKGRKFYKLHPLAFKNKNVREAIREKTSALHKQWLLARQDFLSTKKSAEEREEFRMVEQARTNISRARLDDIKGLPAAEMKYEDFKNLIKSQNVYRLTPEQSADPKVRRIMRERNEALLNDHNRLVASNIRTAISDIKTKDLEHRINPEDVPLGSYAQFRDYLKTQKVYDSIDPSLMKNEEVRKAALAQNQSLYQKLKARLLGAEKADALSEVDTENMHQATIEAIDHFGENLDLAKAKITDYAAFEKAFLDANPEHKSHFFDRAAYRTLLKTQWQDLQAKDKLAGEKSAEATDQLLDDDPNKELKDKVPGHYMIKWNDLDKRLAPSKQAKGLERFNKLLNRSESGLQTLMQHFHQPLGTFVIEALAVAPQERVDRIFNALKEKPIKPGNREQASDWLKTFTETIGVSFLQKETTAGFAALKQNYQTFFGESLINKWEIQDIEAAEEVAAESVDELAPDLNMEGLEDDETMIDPQAQTAQGQDDDVLEVEDGMSDDDLEMVDDIPDAPIEGDEIPEVVPELDPEAAEESIDSIDAIPDDETDEFETPVDTIPTDLEDPNVEPVLAEGETEPTLEEVHALLDDVEAEDEGTETALDTEDDLVDATIDQEDEETDQTTLDAETPEPIDLEPGTEVVFDTNDQAAESADLIAEEDPEPSDTLADDEPDILDTIDEPLPVGIPIEPATPETAEADVEAAEKALNDFMEIVAPRPSSESVETMSQGPQELAPEMWQEIATDEVSKAPKKKASIELLKEIAADPFKRQSLRVDQEKFYQDVPEKTHFYPALFAEVHLTSAMTIEKFLEQVKSYCLLTFDIEARLAIKTNGLAEIDTDDAQTLFKSMADRLHSVQDLTQVKLGFNGRSVQLTANQQAWDFETRLAELVD